MNGSFVISDSVVRALGWTLAHTLWQGAALSLILLVLLTRLHKARQRYLAAYGTLMAVFFAAVATFCWIFEPASSTSTNANDVPTFGPFIATQQQIVQQGWMGNATDWLESHYVAIVLVWLIGFIFFMIRLSTGLWQVHKLQTQHLKPVGAAWQAKIDTLSERLGLKKTVRLFESALARSPMAIGWIKPVVLFPVGLINHLSPAEVEAVLAHELAHIARRDWLFNLLQAFVEALFYYHPAVWWVSAVIRSERENCCDDAALAATGSPLIFAKALVQVQELAIPAPRLALGIGGSSRRPLLLERIRRILNQPQQKSQVMEKLTATAILLALLTFIGLRANTPPTVAAAFSQISDWPGSFWNTGNTDQNSDQIAPDSIPKGKSIQKITREDDHGKVEMELKDGQITRLNLDGKEIPASEFGEYGTLARELQSSIPPPPVPPVPPVPPTQPVPGFPPFPPMAPMAAMPPMPPTPPFVFAAPKITTLTDPEGNVIIKLEKNGQPMEIKVKDGEVWMNGKKLEKGESIDLPGMGFNGEDFNWNINGDQFHFEGFGENDAPAIAFSFSDEDRARWEEQVEKIRADSDKYREQYQELRERYSQMSDDDKAKMQKELKAYEEDWKAHQDKWQSELDHWQKEQGRWQQNQQQWQAQQEKRRAGYQDRNRQKHETDFQRAVQAELLRDNLITNPGDFSFQITSKSLKVNGKKQSGEQHKKYLDLFERSRGKRMEKKDSYSIEVHQ